MAGDIGLLTISLKNADGITADEQLRDLDPDTSVLEVKQMLQASYPGQPPSASMKIVFAGRSVRLRGRPAPACRGAPLLRSVSAAGVAQGRCEPPACRSRYGAQFLAAMARCLTLKLRAQAPQGLGHPGSSDPCEQLRILHGATRLGCGACVPCLLGSVSAGRLVACVADLVEFCPFCVRVRACVLSARSRGRRCRSSSTS